MGGGNLCGDLVDARLLYGKHYCFMRPIFLVKIHTFRFLNSAVIFKDGMAAAEAILAVNQRDIVSEIGEGCQLQCHWHIPISLNVL